MGEDQSRVLVPCGKDAPVERGEVLDVLGDDRSPIGCCGPQQIVIGQPDQVGPLLDGDGVVAAVSQPARDGDGVVAAVSQPARDGDGVVAAVSQPARDGDGVVAASPRQQPALVLPGGQLEVGNLVVARDLSVDLVGANSASQYRLVVRTCVAGRSLRAISGRRCGLRAISASISSVNSA